MNARILVIDDDIAIRELLTLILSEEGYQVIEQSAFCGLDPILAVRPDLILLDARMPRMSGIEASQLIKKHPRMSNVPIVAMSASSPKELAAMQCDAYILKPFDVDNLLHQVEKVLKHKRSYLEPVVG